MRDMLGVWHVPDARAGDAHGRPRLIGPNCPGLISPGQCKVGIMPGHIHKPGPRRAGVAQRHAHLRGGAPADQRRAGPVDLHRHRRRPDHRHQLHRRARRCSRPTRRPTAIVLIGEIGGTDEEEAAAVHQAHVTKPVVAFIAGQTAPPGQAHGPRGRDHLRRRRHRRREDGGVRGGGRAGGARSRRRSRG